MAFIKCQYTNDYLLTSLLSFFNKKAVWAFAFEVIISVVKLTPDGTGYRTKMIFVKEKLLMDRMSDIQLRFFNIG